MCDCGCKCVWEVVTAAGEALPQTSFIRALSLRQQTPGSRVRRNGTECDCKCPACEEAWR